MRPRLLALLAVPVLSTPLAAPAVEPPVPPMAAPTPDRPVNHSRHRDAKTMRGYVGRAKLFTNSPVSLLGL